MESSPEILNELRAISPLIAGLEKLNVFQVPEGYFNELHLRITAYSLVQDSAGMEINYRKNLQKVPRGYFDNLSTSILARVKEAYPERAGEELIQLSATLYKLKDINVFSVPEGYFDALGEAVIVGIGQSDPVSAAEELTRHFVTLSGLKDKNVYSVPEGYFNSLPETITGRIKPHPSRVVPMKKRSTWLQFAAAAVFAGIIAAGAFILFKGSSGSPDQASGTTASLPEYIQASFKYKTEAELDAGLAKLDDASIAKYLEKNGNVMDNELLINNADVSEMPSQTDYLKDENTLNSYLDKIDAGGLDKAKP